MKVQGNKPTAKVKTSLRLWLLSYRDWPKNFVHKEEKMCLQTSEHQFEKNEEHAAQLRGERENTGPQVPCSLPQWSIIHLTNWRPGQIYEFPKLNQNRACSDLQKVTQLYWIFVSIPLPKIKWVRIQGRFRNLPVYSWQLWVSVWKQRAQGMNFPSLNIDALHTGSRGACSKPVSCH